MNAGAAIQANELHYGYRFSSLVDAEAIRLAASGGAAKTDTGGFFDGRLRHPRETAMMLLALSRIVRTHFFDARPPQMDPIVTTSRTLMRWEGFSGCCGAYARLDLEEAALDTKRREFGTTNVDFNPSMLSHLSGVGREDAVGLTISSESVAVRRNDESVVEKRVTLPKRWLKGLCEVQVYQSRLKLRHRFTPATIVPLLHAASRATSGSQYLSLAGGKPRLSTRRSGEAIAVGGANRLSALRTLLPIMREVSLYADEESGVHAWAAESPSARFWLVLSPTLQRGFSGEGQVLESLARQHWRDQVDSVCDVLTGDGPADPAETIDPAELASRLGCTTQQARDALDALAASGMAGFDAHSGYYFQRRLPFDFERPQRDQPRLRSAQKLVDADAVRVVKRINNAAVDVEVTSGETVYLVRLRPDGDRCTCPWFSRHQGERGPCKHVLAAQMALSGGMESEGK